MLASSKRKIKGGKKMGLAASQARILLLTAKNDSLELQAQLISNERLLLSQEQEGIANKYSDATSNTVYKCLINDPLDKDNKDGTTTKVMTLESLAQSYTCGASGKSKKNQQKVYIKYGDKYIGASASYDPSKKEPWSVTYFVSDGKTETPLSSEDPLVIAFNSSGANSLTQSLARNEKLEIYVPAPVTNSSESNNDTNIGGKQYVRKSPESLSNVHSEYYTEDDAAAQAEYQAAMARVNTLDKKLENKLNQVETQKKAVESEMESVDQIIKSNIERTFKYFG